MKKSKQTKKPTSRRSTYKHLLRRRNFRRSTNPFARFTKDGSTIYMLY